MRKHILRIGLILLVCCALCGFVTLSSDADPLAGGKLFRDVQTYAASAFTAPPRRVI